MKREKESTANRDANRDVFKWDQILIGFQRTKLNQTTRKVNLIKTRDV